MTSLMATAPSQVGTEIFDRILAAPSGLIVLNSKDATALITQFRVIARHTGQAVYLWQPDVGLSSLRDAHVRVPDCQRLNNALRYMQHSMHFGVYFLAGLQFPLSATDTSLLRQLARAPTAHLRRVVLINAPTALGEPLGCLAVHLDGEVEQAWRPRLRDGRWLV